MPKYRKKVCRECGRVYQRRHVRTSGTLGWCGPSYYMKDYWLRRKGKAAGEPPDPIDDSAIQEPRVIEALAAVLRGDRMEEEAMAEKQAADEIADSDKTGELDINVVADRPLVPQTRFEEDNSVRVEWRGLCWAWLTGGEAPALMEVAVSDGEVVKLLKPGAVRRVRAIERPVKTPEGPVDGLEVWMEFGGEPEPDRRATARGLWEGGKVRIAEGGLRAEINGKVGTLLQFTVGTIEVDGKRYSIGLKDLEPLDDPTEPPAGTDTR